MRLMNLREPLKVQTGMFLTTSTDLDERPGVISSCILYLKDSVVQTKHVKVFSHNKPWLNEAVMILDICIVTHLTY